MLGRQEKKSKNKTYYSRVDIELINEQVKLFYSTLDEVEISWSQDAFSIMEYVQLGVEEQLRFYPLKRLPFVLKKTAAMCWTPNFCLSLQN